MFINAVGQKNLEIGGYVGLQTDSYGMDSIGLCRDKKLFQNYPHTVTYHFNELGYRERPVNEFSRNSVICIGDSFTVGLGLPFELTYPQQLQKIINYPVLNFGLNGASNDWIARKLKTILSHFTPPVIVVHYTFSHRRELDNHSWFDDERTLCDVNMSDNAAFEDYENWRLCYNFVNSLNVPVVHSFIPRWHNPDTVPSECIVPFQLDLSRDGFHYGENTCRVLAEKLALKISSTGASLPC